VIASDHPFLLEGETIDFRVGAGDSIIYIDGRNTLKHKGILVAANEAGLFRHGVGNERVANLSGG